MIPDFSYYPVGLYLGVGFYLMWMIFEHVPRLFWEAWNTKAYDPGPDLIRLGKPLPTARVKPTVFPEDDVIPEPPVGGTGESTSAYDEMIQDIVDRAHTTGISKIEAEIMGSHYRHNYDPETEGYPISLFGERIIYAAE